MTQIFLFLSLLTTKARAPTLQPLGHEKWTIKFHSATALYWHSCEMEHKWQTAGAAFVPSFHSYSFLQKSYCNLSVKTASTTSEQHVQRRSRDTCLFLVSGVGMTGDCGSCEDVCGRQELSFTLFFYGIDLKGSSWGQNVLLEYASMNM